MTIQLDKDLLYSTFNVSSFNQLDAHIQTLAPSMVEYYLSDLASNADDSTYINKSNVETSIYLDEYTLYCDYSDDIYLEFVQKEDELETESLW